MKLAEIKSWAYQRHTYDIFQTYIHIYDRPIYDINKEIVLFWDPPTYDIIRAE